MRVQSIQTFNSLSWYPFTEEPILDATLFTPRLCDPTFIMPEDSPDNTWHLFAHNWIGIQHYTSNNGLDWTSAKMIELRGHSPFIFFNKGLWYLIYEKHDSTPDSLEWQEITGKNRRLSRSRIEICHTEDMVNFSKPQVLLDSEDVPFAKDRLQRARLSRPQLFYDEKYGYRLFFGASHILMKDTKQKASLYFAMASSKSLLGPYEVANDNKPLISPDADDKYRNLATGSIRILPTKNNGYIAFECAFGWDKENKKSVSALIQLESKDGIIWKQSNKKPLITLPKTGWASRYVTSCDIRYMKDDYCFYCYFSANARVKFGPFSYVKESLGLLLGKDPLPRKVFEDSL
ncbi:MAG: hypothetical protein PQJ49_05270 [Sphaerochaetaceae bacterium]|nr:hypothetical protein [Sphaerochaetaceae bacterium]MDC7236338.1 hypothetical protein [Sphaerochaetaceae bacterium]MDC7249312.1 hypothetical protein [Sphaerochaetaceae bacterium]